MKIRIDYHTKSLLKHNFPIFLTLLVLLALLCVGFYLFVQTYQKNNSDTAALQREVADLNKKKELIDFKNEVIRDEIDLDRVNAIFTQLIPTKEDFFSIIIALEKLSQKTNFIITSYTIAVGDSTEGKLAIVIEGQGDPDIFLEFLKQYNFGSGRLITIDKIEFSQEAFTGSKIGINVYSGKGAGAKVLSEFTREERNLIQKVLGKVELELTSEEKVSTDYPTKNNPF